MNHKILGKTKLKVSEIGLKTRNIRTMLITMVTGINIAAFIKLLRLKSKGLNSHLLKETINNQQTKSVTGYTSQPALAPANNSATSKMMRLTKQSVFHLNELILLINPIKTNGNVISINSANHPLFENKD